MEYYRQNIKKIIDKKNICNSNALYFRYPFSTFLDTQRDIGIDTIELWGSVPHLWIDHIDYENCDWIKKQIFRNRLKLISFTPRPYNYSLCSKFNTIRREYSLAYYLNCLEVAAELGATYMCVGSTGGEFDESYENLWDYYRESLYWICNVAEKHEVTILIETALEIDSKIVTKLSELKKIFDEVNSDNLKIVLNTHSLSVAGETINQWFDIFGENIVHTHFIDGRNTGSRIWGEGCYPLGKYLTDLTTNQYKGYLGQLIINDRYHYEPVEADKRNILALSQYKIGGKM